MTKIYEKPLLYGVIGHPVKHSVSPRIHRAFAAQFNIPLQYDAIDIEPNDFKNSIEMLKRRGYLGFNVTLPFKETAYRFANKKTERAEGAGAVNILYFQQNDVIGDNNDGIGFIRDLTLNHQFSLKDKRILLLGAGGALRGILFSILTSNPATIHMANRTVEKAEIIAKKFSEHMSISTSDLDNIPSTSFDIVINTTSFGISDNQILFPQHIFSNNHFFYDLVYNLETKTPFLQLAQQHGATRLIDGIGMLIEQAAESFLTWHHVHPKTQGILEQLKNKEI